MNARRFAAALLACVLSAGLPGCVLPPDAPTVLASAGGTGANDAYVVSSVAQEYEILRLLGLQSQSQQLHRINGRSFDVVRAVNPRTEEAREVWFDISRFFDRQ